MEAHKNAATFIASSRPTVHGHAGPGPRQAGIWMEINQEFAGIRNRGIAIDGGENERGPVGLNILFCFVLHQFNLFCQLVLYFVCEYRS
jgi:hypothetical protein